MFEGPIVIDINRFRSVNMDSLNVCRWMDLLVSSTCVLKNLTGVKNKNRIIIRQFKVLQKQSGFIKKLSLTFVDDAKGDVGGTVCSGGGGVKLRPSPKRCILITTHGRGYTYT